MISSKQYVVLLEIGSRTARHAELPVIMEDIGYTQTTANLMDMTTDCRVSLPIQVSKGPELRMYCPNSKEKPYAVRIMGLVVLRSGRDVVLDLWRVKLVHHAKLLLLIGPMFFVRVVRCGCTGRWGLAQLVGT